MGLNNPTLPNTINGWKALIEDQFGAHAWSSFEKQISYGTSLPSEYYQTLVQSFELDVQEFLVFSEKYQQGGIYWGPSLKLRKDSKKILDRVRPKLLEWSILHDNDDAKLTTLKECYAAYLEAIDFLASQIPDKESAIPPLVCTIENDWTRTALSLIRSKNVNIAICIHGKYTPLTIALKKNNRVVVLALFESGKIHWSEILSLPDPMKKEGDAIEYHYNNNMVFTSFRNREMVGVLLYYFLVNATADAADTILHTDVSSLYTKEDVLQCILSLADSQADVHLKANILYNAIAVYETDSDDVNYTYPNALSYYFHVVNSPNDVVAKIYTKLNAIQSEHPSIQLTIKSPVFGLKDIRRRNKLPEAHLTDYFSHEFLEQREHPQESTLSPNPDHMKVLKSSGRYIMGSAAVSVLIGVAVGCSLAFAAHVTPAYAFLGFLGATILMLTLLLARHLQYIEQEHPEVLLHPIKVRSGTSELTYKPTYFSYMRKAVYTLLEPDSTVVPSTMLEMK